MYKNIIAFNGEPMFTFFTADLVFTTNSSRYKRVQEVLVGMGYEMRSNHLFGDLGKKWLHFSCCEMKMYQPGKHLKEFDIEKENWDSLESSYTKLFLTNLRDIFVRELPVDLIECELLMTRAPDATKTID